MPLPPLRFDPLLKPKVWGGRGLESLGKSLPADTAVGESWELADLPSGIPDGRSRVSGGPLEGRFLHDLLAAHERSILGHAARSAEGGFPLLLKYLDAQDNLSVQVHPDEAYVARHPETRLKSEAWFILDAAPGSVIYAGLTPGVDREHLAASIADGTVVEHLVAIPAVPGHCHYLPSGTCHALGAGVLVAEVQTPSDTTFRIWDWGRTGRELHVDQALECIDFSGTSVVKDPPSSRHQDGIEVRTHVDVTHFRIDQLTSGRNGTIPLDATGGPDALMVLDGEGQLQSGTTATTLTRGDTILLPADRDQTVVSVPQSLDLLLVTLHAQADD